MNERSERRRASIELKHLQIGDLLAFSSQSKELERVINIKTAYSYSGNKIYTIVTTEKTAHIVENVVVSIVID